MKLRNKTKFELFTYKLHINKYIVILIGIQFVIHTSILADNTQISVLKQIRTVIQEKSLNDTLLQNIDSTITTKQIT